MKRPLLSVVMPVHGGGQWLDAALASVHAGPGESCEGIVKRHAGRLRIDYAYLPEIPSWTHKTNLAVEAASAEHVCHLHQDDLWLEDRLAVAREMIVAAPDAALFLTPALIVDGAGKRLGQWHPPFRAGLIDSADYRDALLVQNSIAIPAPVFRRDAYLAAGGMDESLWYTPDWDLWFKLAEQGPVYYDPRAVTAFRIHKNSLTMTGDRREFAEQMDLVLERNLRAGGKTERISRTSARINALLSDAALGHSSALIRAVVIFLALGPADGSRYIRYSRIVERIMPRLKLRFAGVM
jgi:GT2 family glycosyltransferase